MVHDMVEVRVVEVQAAMDQFSFRRRPWIEVLTDRGRFQRISITGRC